MGTGVILYFEDCSATKCIVDKIQAESVAFRSIIGMKNVDAQPGWLPVLTVCMWPLLKGCRGFRSHVAAHADESGSKALTDLLSSINKSFRGFPLDGKLFRSI